MKTMIAKLGWAGIALLSAVVAIFSYRYAARIGFIPPNIAANRFFDPWIIIHASAASTALLLGPLQFLAAVRRRWPRAHRWLGRTYVVSCLVGGVAALVLARGVSAGVIAGAGFGTLAVLWLFVTAKGWSTARARNFSEHRQWMIRSFALTFSAVTLRLYLPIGHFLSHDFMASYRIIAWLAWVPNAILAELYLRKWYGFRSRVRPAHAFGD